MSDFERMHPAELITRPPFASLFPIRRELQARITQSMREKGFDESKPINVWRDEMIVVDGHTRRQAAIEAKTEVIVCFHDFKDDDDAMDYAIANQRDRRNLTDAELASLVLAVDSRKKAGRPTSEKELASSDANSGKSAAKTAALTGTSPKKVEKIRAIADHAEATGDEEELDAVLKGEKSINMAANDVKAKKEKAKRERSSTSKPHPSVLASSGESATATFLEPALSPEDKAYLEGFPLRSKVVKQRFDDDALIYRAIVRPNRDAISRIIGKRSASLMGHVHKAAHKLLSMSSPDRWHMCDACQGSGIKIGSCTECRGCGYLVPTT